MKLCALILSLLVLSMVSVPCADAYGLHDDTEQTEDCCDSRTEKQAEHEDECSPFCICHCCHSHTVVSYPFLFEAGTDLPAVMQSELLPLPTSGFKGAILQPPRV
ncbi:MAG: DUF6660 family protein [Cyclobacteriaceae bacterium]